MKHTLISLWEVKGHFVGSKWVGTEIKNGSKLDGWK